MIALGFLSFLVFGIALVLLGASQTDLARSLGLDLTRTGMLAAALSAGLGVGVAGAGPLVDRYPRRPLYLAAMVISASALLGFDAGMGFARALACCVLLGLGLGIYDVLVATLVVERYRERAPRPMVLVHAGATLGAFSCPFFVGLAASRAGWIAAFHWAGLAHLALAALVLLLPLPAPALRATLPLRGVLVPAMLPFAVVSFAYVGIEAALTIFALPYAAEGLGLGSAGGRHAISSLWAGLLLGRLAVLALPGVLDARLLVAAGLSSAALLGGGAALGLRPVELHFGACGAALGCVFPLLVALTGQRFPESRASAVGVATAAGALGGFVVPWLHGAIGDAAGAPAAVGSLALWSLAMAAAGWFAMARR